MSQVLLATYRAAVAAHQADDLDTALEKYQACLSIQPVPAILNNVAAIQLSRGEKQAAEESWRRAVRAKPDYAEAHYNLAVLLSESGDSAKLDEAAAHCELALAHREGYVKAQHLMGNIRMSQGAREEAAQWYAKAEAVAAAAEDARPASAEQQHGSSSASGAGAPPAGSFRWDGVEVGYTRTLQLPSGASWVMQTLSLRPLAFLVRGFLSNDECDELVALAQPKLRDSLMMGNATASERTSQSVFLPASDDPLLGELQARLSALTQLPLAQVRDVECPPGSAHDNCRCACARRKLTHGARARTSTGRPRGNDVHARVACARRSVARRTCRWCTMRRMRSLACTTTRPASCPAS
jgi:hypothetical protein